MKPVCSGAGMADRDDRSDTLVACTSDAESTSDVDSLPGHDAQPTKFASERKNFPSRMLGPMAYNTVSKGPRRTSSAQGPDQHHRGSSVASSVRSRHVRGLINSLHILKNMHPPEVNKIKVGNVCAQLSLGLS